MSCVRAETALKLVGKETSLHEIIGTDKSLLAEEGTSCLCAVSEYLQIFNKIILFLPCLLPPLQLFDSLHFEEIPFHLSKPVAAYEEALQLVKEGKVACRTLR